MIDSKRIQENQITSLVITNNFSQVKSEILSGLIFALNNHKIILSKTSFSTIQKLQKYIRKILNNVTFFDQVFEGGVNECVNIDPVRGEARACTHEIESQTDIVNQLVLEERITYEVESQTESEEILPTFQKIIESIQFPLKASFSTTELEDLIQKLNL